MQPTEPLFTDNLLTSARHAADQFRSGDMNAALAEVQKDTMGLNGAQLQQFFADLARQAKTSSSHNLPGLEITEQPQLKVTAHNGKVDQVLFDQSKEAPHVQEPNPQDAQKAQADVEEAQKSPPVRLGEGYYQPLKRMHPDWTHKQLMDKIHEIKARLGQHHVLRVGERFDTMSPEEKQAAVNSKLGHGDKGPSLKQPPEHNPGGPEHPGNKPGEKNPEQKPEDKPPSHAPEKTQDGGTTTYDANGNKRTTWANGAVRVENKDGTGYAQNPDGHGGYHVNHWGPKAADNYEQDRKIENTGGADAGFQKRVGEAYAHLPPGVRKVLDKNGTQIVTAGKISEVHPEWKGTPRGYPPGSTFDNCDGVYDGTKIIIPEHADAVQQDPEGVLRHEAGHAFDKALGNYSHSKEFEDAYQRDLAKLTPEQRKQLDYYLQNGEAGPEELFAELFCSAVGGRPDKNHFPLDMAKLFPETYGLVQKKIQNAG
ncbi:MAG TPA: hypothetical protein V6C81_15445 [Planktothrix sp.]|jgi:hypothetical protein